MNPQLLGLAFLLGFVGAPLIDVAHRTWLRRRVRSLLTYNNAQVEKRRRAVVLLREAAALFRTYEGHHRAKLSEAGRPEKAERNAEIACRIETFIQEIHQ